MPRIVHGVLGCRDWIAHPRVPRIAPSHLQGRAPTGSANRAWRPRAPCIHGRRESRRTSVGGTQPWTVRIVLGVLCSSPPLPIHHATHFAPRLQHLINSSQTRCFPRAHRIESNQHGTRSQNGASRAQHYSPQRVIQARRQQGGSYETWIHRMRKYGQSHDQGNYR